MQLFTALRGPLNYPVFGSHERKRALKIGETGSDAHTALLQLSNLTQRSAWIFLKFAYIRLDLTASFFMDRSFVFRWLKTTLSCQISHFKYLRVITATQMLYLSWEAEMIIRTQ